MFLDLLDRHVEDASIRFTIRGEPVSVGRGAPGGVAVRINDDRFFRRVLSGGNLGLGESFMDGDWELEEGDIADLLTVLFAAALVLSLAACQPDTKNLEKKIDDMAKTLCPNC